MEEKISITPADQDAGPSNQEDVRKVPPAKRVKLKKFKDSWLLIPEFSGWLQAVEGDLEKAFCTYCQKKLKCGKSEFQRHASRNVHIRKAALAVSADVKPQVYQQDVYKAAVKTAEVKLSAFCAKHNIGTRTVDHLLPLLKESFIDSRIAQDINILSQTKCTDIIKNCIGKRGLHKLVDILKVQKFSVLVDENTDITDMKSLCVLVQFVSPDTKKVVAELLELVELGATKCSAENVYAAFKSCLESKGVPISNIVGIASDNSSVMTGTQSSFMTRLKSDAPGLVVLNCICHSSTLIASKACATLPRFCEDLIRSIATYESDSAKPCAVLRDFQELIDVETRTILKSSDTRWLSMQKCVVCLLDNWDTLKIYFTLAVNEDKIKSAETILTNLNNEVLKAYLLFLKYSLNFFNSFNALFQSRKVLIHKLSENSRLLISQFGCNFLKRKVLKKLTSGTLNIADPQNFIGLDQVILGPECERVLTKIPPTHVKELRQNCLQFYVTAVTEMASRLPLKPSFLDELRFLAPGIALNLEDRGSVRDLSAVAERFGTFDLSKLAFEWNSLPSAFTEDKKKSLLTLEVDSFWKEVVQTKNFLDENMFPILEQIVTIVLSLPHSNAEAQRIFSIVTEAKTKKRNKIDHPPWEFAYAKCM